MRRRSSAIPTRSSIRGLRRLKEVKAADPALRAALEARRRADQALGRSARRTATGCRPGAPFWRDKRRALASAGALSDLDALEEASQSRSRTACAILIQISICRNGDLC